MFIAGFLLAPAYAAEPASKTPVEWEGASRGGNIISPEEKAQSPEKRYQESREKFNQKT